MQVFFFIEPSKGFDRDATYDKLLDNMGHYYQVDFCVQEGESNHNDGNLVYVHKNQEGSKEG